MLLRLYYKAHSFCTFTHFGASFDSNMADQAGYVSGVTLFVAILSFKDKDEKIVKARGKKNRCTVFVLCLCIKHGIRKFLPQPQQGAICLRNSIGALYIYYIF